MVASIWKWIVDHKRWLAVPAIIAAILWAWRRVRLMVTPPPSVAPSPAPSKKQVEEQKDAIEKEAADKREAIRKDDEDLKAKILGKFGPGCMVLALCLWSCSANVVRPVVTSAPLENMITACQRNEDVVTCPRAVFSSGLQSHADCLADEAECQVSLDEARGLASVDIQAATARATNAEYQLGQEKNRKWVWGVVGVCGGLILGAGITAAAIIAK